MTPTTDEVLEAWAQWQTAQALSTRTIRERAITIRALVDHAGCGPLDITPAHIISWLARDITPITKASYHASIRAYCAWAQRTRRRPDDPSLDTPTPKRPKCLPRPISQAQLNDMLTTCTRSRTRCMILFAALAGLRVHEIAKLHGHDIDTCTGVLTVTGKGGKTAMIPMHPLLVAEARLWPADGYWFPSYTRQGPITAQSVSQAISRVMHKAGIVGGKPHQLRHFYGTELVRAGVHLRIVQSLMRHESPATTAIYTQITLTEQRAGIRLLTLAA
ncbi:tyrosine-type recombinase/integrase [Pseudoclavibacter sp. 13-3]|uniref:tyrosine-type recombinase/integrase n=1 Tax=Pseudoclavibacter sp. 13-3 TaxID=2901228 RepID=UPI001E37D81D|nr:tyrosine-type recombinase/integrase [Pseudoclavibacter sp. 13-3]MCD7101737.1 tyrosine-type recombinase/integrase [Pseudoclavibacter sp. 13-3]